jgi:hypothetical protein
MEKQATEQREAHEPAEKARAEAVHKAMRRRLQRSEQKQLGRPWRS